MASVAALAILKYRKVIDFVKVNLPNDTLKSLNKSKELDFKILVSKKTGEYGNKEIAEYKGLKFIVHNSGYIQMQGSLHKYWNHGEHNYDDFTFNDLQEVLVDLERRFGIDLQRSTIGNIEFGVNIQPHVPANDILDNLMYHQGKIYEVHSLHDGNYKQVRHQRYFVKAYNKSLQYAHLGVRDHNILRIELKYIKMIDLQVLGINCLSDLRDRSLYDNLKNLLCQRWKETILYDITINKEVLNVDEQHMLLKWQVPNYWLKLGKEQRLKEKRQYCEIVESHSNKVQDQILILIKSKWDYLMINKTPTIKNLLDYSQLLQFTN